MNNDSLNIKLYNKTIVSRDTIILHQTTPVYLTTNTYSANYTYQAWGLILVVLFIGLLFYFKKNLVISNGVSTIERNRFIPATTKLLDTTDNINKPILIKEAIPKINLNNNVIGDVSLDVKPIVN